MNATVLKFNLQIKNNEINESYKLCHVRDKQTVGGIVFYKHLFLVGVMSLRKQNLKILCARYLKKYLS